MHIYNDIGTRKIPKMLDLNACKLSGKERNAMLGSIHSEGMTMYLVFFNLGAGNTLITAQFLDSSLGENWNLTEHEMKALEHFLCSTFGKKTCILLMRPDEIFFGRSMKKMERLLISHSSPLVKTA